MTINEHFLQFFRQHLTLSSVCHNLKNKNSNLFVLNGFRVLNSYLVLLNSYNMFHFRFYGINNFHFCTGFSHLAQLQDR